jgi:amino acid transporter
VSNSTKTPTKLQARILRLFIIGLGFLGSGFIAYGIVAQFTGEVWRPLERTAEPVSSGLAILGTMVVCLSIYFESSQTPLSHIAKILRHRLLF